MRVWRAGEGISQTFQTITSELLKTQIMIIRNYTRGPEASLLRHNNSFLKYSNMGKNVQVWEKLATDSVMRGWGLQQVYGTVEVLMASVSKWWDWGKCSAGVRKKTAAQRLRGAHCTRQSRLSVGLWSHSRADVSCAAPRKNIWSQRQKIFTTVSCASEPHRHRTWLCLMWCSRWSGIHDNWKVRASSFLDSQCQNSILTPY